MKALFAQYFLNHRLDPEELEWQVEALAKAGYQGLYAHARQGLLTPYMSEAWWQALDKIMEVCRRLGLEFWIWDEDYFPSGLAGGRVVWSEPGLIACGLDFTIAEVEGAGPFEVDFAPGMLLRAFAVQKDGKFTDITKYCGTRRQKWTTRRILHSAYSPEINPIGHPHWRCAMEDNRFALCWQPERPGTYTVVGVLVRKTTGVHPDILRPEGIQRFIEMSYEPYFQRYGKEFGKTIKGAFTDEPSPGGFLYPWTPRFPEEFQKDHGYDLMANLPHLVLDLGQRSAAVRHHYRLTQHRLQSENYVGQIARWCEAHDILMAGHLTRTEWLSLVAAWWPNELRCYKAMHIPTADPLGASCGWSAASAYHTGLKVASSAAHLFGRAQAGSDALAVVGDEASIRDLKYMLDYQMVLGINYFSIHGLSYSIDGPRKDEVPPSIFYQHTEWKHMGPLMEHVRSTCEALTGGTHLCELAVLYPSTSLACQLKGSSGRVSLPDEALIHSLVENLLSRHRDFDFIDEITLQERMDSKGQLTTPEHYTVILLPYLWYIDEATAEALRRFAQAGGKVIAIGRMPKALTKDLRSPARAWADRSIQFWKTVTDAALTKLPGISVTGNDAQDVFVLQRQKDGHTITFVFNRSDRPFIGKVAGKAVCIPPRQGMLLSNAIETPPLEHVADLSSGWTVTFEQNHIPLNFWHVARTDTPIEPTTAFAGPGFDLMSRQPDPTSQGDGPARYNCRFMLTGRVPDARLVMEDSTIAGQWKVYVNGRQIKGWKRSVVFDCRNIEASVGHALLEGSTPTLNIITIETHGPGRGLKEVPYLYGTFRCEYRYAHLSLPFLTGTNDTVRLETLQSWNALGYPTFSGSAIYRRQIMIEESGDYILDLGRVEDVAAVDLDGKRIAVVPWPPYQIGLGVLKNGKHELAVEITNAPGNRNRAAGLPAGLLGPVSLMRRRRG